MGPDRRLLDDEALGDLTVREAARDQPEDPSQVDVCCPRRTTSTPLRQRTSAYAASSTPSSSASRMKKSPAAFTRSDGS